MKKSKIVSICQKILKRILKFLLLFLINDYRIYFQIQFYLIEIVIKN